MRKVLLELFKSKEVRRALWTVLNSLMALTVASIVYLAGQDIEVALIVLPFAQALSQLLTKSINK